MGTSLKPGFAQIFSCCPKNLSCPNFGGAAVPLAPPPPPPPPPARTPMVLRFRVLGASFSRFRGLRFRSRVLRFRVLGASFSRFGCFVLRSSFSSASFSKLPHQIQQLLMLTVRDAAPESGSVTGIVSPCITYGAQRESENGFHFPLGSQFVKPLNNTTFVMIN